MRPLIPEDGGGPSAARVVDADPADDTLLTVRFKNRPQNFTFDRVFMMDSTQQQVTEQGEHEELFLLFPRVTFNETTYIVISVYDTMYIVSVI